LRYFQRDSTFDMQIALQEWDFDPVGVETVPNRHKNGVLNIINSMKNYLKILNLSFQMFHFLFCHFASRLSDIRVIRKQLRFIPIIGLLWGSGLKNLLPNYRTRNMPAEDSEWCYSISRLFRNASASFYCATTVFRLLPRAAGKIELFYSTRLLYFGNSLVNHFIVFTGAHL